MTAKFEAHGDDLFIDGKKVLKAWESFSGWFWFGVEKDDQIWFGFVQGFEEEWGHFSQGEIEAMGKFKVWPIPKASLPYSGRRSHENGSSRV